MSTAEFDFTVRVLKLFADADLRDDLFWRTDGGYAPVTFFANCSDVFDWATADCEKITPDNVQELERAFADVESVTAGDFSYGPALFACRVRNSRPQNASYPGDLRLHAWFDSCGPQRPVDETNPHARKRGEPEEHA